MSKNNTLGSRIKELRQNMGLSQSELASKLNCTQAALSQYESGNREPGLRDLKTIAKHLDTTTDYLLGLTDIPHNNVNVRMIGDYLGLTEESINVIHSTYLEYLNKTDEDVILEDLKFFSNVSPTDSKYDVDYNFLKNGSCLDLLEYKQAINDFICSPVFWGFVSCLKDNLHIDRRVHDVFRIVAKQYDLIQTPFPTTDIAEMAYCFAEADENLITQYSLNVFDATSAITEYIKNYTKLEDVKAIERKKSLYRNILLIFYLHTRPMFEKNEYSLQELEVALDEVFGEKIDMIKQLL